MSATTASASATTRPARAMRARLLAFAGMALLVLAMAFVIGGILVPALFLPGTWLMLLGIVVLAAAAIMMAARGSAAGTADRTGAPARRDA